jgi:ribosome-associated translation inhibitor RaiA
MQIPLELTVRGFEAPADLEATIRRRAAKLERFHPRVMACRVAVEQPHEHASSGSPYRIRLEVTVPPGHDIVVREEPGQHELHDELLTVVNHAFAVAERRLKRLNEQQNA